MRLFRLFLLVGLLCPTLHFGQTITLKGKILDGATQVPLEAATVYVTQVKDSAVIDYTITDRTGAFSIKVRQNALPALLKVSYVGYQDLVQQLSADQKDHDFGILRVKENANMIGEVIVKGEAPPIRIKKDTLEFNASSFKVRPDSNVETLLRQLPGVDIDAEGKITVNGKEVKQILVNGKPFFDADGKIALQNLPADIVNKVQVTDAKTKQEEIAGKPAASNDASINLTVDEDKNKGVFGRAMGGIGSSKRYESSVMFNYFKDKRKISVLGAVNNINTVGFSMNEIFDSMGSLRNSSIYVGDQGEFGINDMRFGGNRGITRSNLGGLSYSDEFFKGFDFSSNYFYIGSHTDNHNRLRETTLLPEGNLFTESTSNTRDDKSMHNVTGSIEYKIDSTATLYLSPKFVRANVKSGNAMSRRSYDGIRTLNESDGYTFSDADNTTASNSIYFNKNLKRKGSRIAADFDHFNTKDEIVDLNRSDNRFYEDPSDPSVVRYDRRDQRKTERNLRDNYFVSGEFQQRISDSLNVHMGFEYLHHTSSYDRVTRDFDPALQDYVNVSDSLSRFLLARTRRWNPKAGFNLEKKNLSWYVDLGTSVIDFETRAQYLGSTTRLQKKFLLPFANSNFRYALSKSTNFYASYWYNIDMPEANQILPVSDFTDPLNTITGNASVNPNTRHGLYLNLGNWNHASKSGMGIYGGGEYYENQIVSFTVYDAAGKRNTTFANVSGTFNTWFGGNWNRSFKKDAHSFKFSLGINSGINKSKGFTDGHEFEATSSRIGPRANFTYDYGELFSINPTYNFTYNETNYRNYTIAAASNSVHRLGLQMTSYWPKHVVFGNDFSYTYNTAIADGFKKDFLLWNASLGYNFMADRLLAKVKVYDVLDQNQNAVRTISSTNIRDEQNDVLKRYLMFSLTYKLEKFAGKKKEENRFWWFD